MSFAERTSRLEVIPSPKPRLAEAAAAVAVSRSSRASASRRRATSTSRAAFWTSCRTWSRAPVSAARASAACPSACAAFP